MEFGLPQTLSRACHNAGRNSGHQNQLQQLKYPDFHYLYAVAYDAIIDMYRRHQAQKHLFHPTISQFPPHQTVQSSYAKFKGMPDPKPNQSPQAVPRLTFKPFATNLASEENICRNRKNYPRKVKSRHEEKKKTYRKGGYPYNIDPRIKNKN